MDPRRNQNPQMPHGGPSIDGFLPAGHPQTAGSPQPSQQAARPVSPRPGTPTPPSAAKHPFMPATFFEPPELPKLPKIEELPPPPPKKEAKQNQGLRDILSVMGVLASALLLAFCLINFVFQSYQVDGPSMRTTLENRDHLIVWKVDKTIANATGGAYIPNRGDVVIFDEPAGAEPGGPAGKQLIKRVLALPGERIVIQGTSVLVYNKEHPEGFNPDTTLPYGDKIIFHQPSNTDVTVKEGEVFVAGDNRDNSLDSRVFGPISHELIVGKLVVRILPLNTFKLF